MKGGNYMSKFIESEGAFSSYYASATDAWNQVYLALNKYGDICSPRGKKIKETLNADIMIADATNNLVMSSFRGMSPVYAAREYSWYKEGSRNPKDAPRSAFWETIANEGLEKDNGLINSNYGHWLFVKPDPIDPSLTVWERTIKLLEEDPDTRHAIIQLPIMDYRGTKDTPCTSSIQFFLRDGKLNSTVYMRSCDLVYGWPYDIFQFTMWQQELAYELKCEVGFMRFLAGSLHIYEEDFIENRGGEEEFIDCYQRDLLEKAILYPEYSSSKYNKIFLEDIEGFTSEGKSYEPKSTDLSLLKGNMKVWKREQM